MVANQGWVECVANETLLNLFGDVDFSEDGAEATKLIAWMQNADNDPMGTGSY